MELTWEEDGTDDVAQTWSPIRRWAPTDEAPQGLAGAVLAACEKWARRRVNMSESELEPAVRPLTQGEVHDWATSAGGGVLAVCLFGGDRNACCPDGGVGVVVNGEVVAVASISRDGEDNSGRPGIVGVMTRPGHRRKGYGLTALRGAVHRMLALGMPTPYRVDCVTAEGAALVRALGPAERAVLDIREFDWSEVEAGESLCPWCGSTAEPTEHGLCPLCGCGPI